MIWDFDIGRTFTLVASTWRFLLLRLAVFAGVALMFFLVTGTGTLGGYAIGNNVSGTATGYQYGIFGTIGGFALASFIFRLLRSYILYLVKAAHIAVLVRIMDGGEMPAGSGQIAYGQEIVANRFVEANALFAVDLLVKAILKSLGKFLSGVAGFIPVPGLRALVGALRAVADNAVGFADEIILAEILRRPEGNPWEISRKALVLYAQNAGPIIRNAIWLTLFLALFTLAVFVVLVGPFAASFALLPQANAVYGIIAAGLVAVFIKETLLEPLAVVALMQVFTAVTDGQEPDPEWDRKLEELSASFRDLKDKAYAGVTGSVDGAAKNPWS